MHAGKRARTRRDALRAAVALASALAAVLVAWPAAAQPGARAVDTIPGMPPVADPANLYGETRSDKLSPAVATALSRVYVPNLKSNDVYVIDPSTLKVVDRFRVGINPQHIVPSYDLKTLWATNNAEGRTDGSLTPIDPVTGKPGRSIAVDDPYNMYFTPDGRSAIVVAEALKRLDFRDPQTMALQGSLAVPQCAGINHADFSIDGRFVIFTCEFEGSLAKIDLVGRKVLGYLKLSKGGMPQDIRVSPDGKTFFVADMKAGGVFVIDGDGRHASTARRTARAASPSSTSPPAASSPRGRFREAGARTWAMSAWTARSCGSLAATTTWSTRSTPPQVRCGSSRSARSPTASPSGPNPAVIPWATPETCASQSAARR